MACHRSGAVLGGLFNAAHLTIKPQLHVSLSTPPVNGPSKRLFGLTMIDRFFEQEPMTKLDKVLFAFASYNAGPGRVAQLRKEAAKRGLDENVWFRNVEYIAEEKIGRETVTYVSNIYKYYVAYRLIQESLENRAEAMKKIKGVQKN